MHARKIARNRQWRWLTLVVATGMALIVPFFVASPADAKRKPIRPVTTTAPSTTSAPTTTATTQPTTTSTTAPPSTTGSYPTTPPAQICGSVSLNGPTLQPANSVRIDPGANLSDATAARPAGTTFWLAPGTHTLGTSEFSQVVPKEGNTYIGAPGAVLDGQRINRYAFTQKAANVTIRHLTIRRFGVIRGNRNEGVVNHDSGTGWTIERNTVTENAGAGVFIGSDNVVRFNCLKDNGQYGFSMWKPRVPGASAITNITLEGNEIAGNNTDAWETVISNCGCTGGGKFWDVGGATIIGNWVHHNRGVGLWPDTNDIGFRIEGNYINDNDNEGLFYEISYNALIKNNTFKRNALVKGKAFADRGSPFPVAAVYLSEAGGDARLNGGVYSTLEVTGNLFEDNWGGVALWENADRFCGSPANTSGNYCTRVNPDANFTTCSDPATGGLIANEPYKSDCRWKTQNVHVHNNDFRMDKAAIGCTTAYCGLNALLSNWGTYPTWSPYMARTVQDAVTYGQNNRFTNNRYVGDWKFNPYEMKRVIELTAWKAAPYNQDAGSTKA